MFIHPNQVKCPVGGNTLGYRNLKEVCTFLCKDCGFFYTWDRDGKLLKPTKNTFTKHITCGCESCKYRDSH